MKKFLFTVLTSAVFSSLQSQNFTIGKIYDYQVGDTIVEEFMPYKSQFSSGPPTTTMRVITGKIFSTNMDSVFYTEFRASNTPSMGANGWMMTYTNTVHNYTVTGLATSMISHSLSGSPCQVQHDTSFVNSCGYNTHVKSLKMIQWQGFCEPPILIETFIEGIGVYTHTVCNNCINKGSGWQTKLLYAKKVGQPECGSRVNIITGTSELELPLMRATIFPNPSTGTFYIKVSGSGIAEVYSATGHLVEKMDLVPGSNKMQMGDQPEGIYFISTFINGQRDYQKLIKY